MLCSYCVIEDHRIHNTISVFQYADGKRDMLKVGVISLFGNLNLENFEKDEYKTKEDHDKALEELLKQVEKIKELLKINEKRIKDLNEKKRKN